MLLEQQQLYIVNTGTVLFDGD